MLPAAPEEGRAQAMLAAQIVPTRDSEEIDGKRPVHHSRYSIVASHFSTPFKRAVETHVILQLGRFVVRLPNRARPSGRRLLLGLACSRPKRQARLETQMR